MVEVAEREALFASPQHPYTRALLSAIPHPDPETERTRERIVLTGDVPPPSIRQQAARSTRAAPTVATCPADRCSRETPALVTEPGRTAVSAPATSTPDY